MPRPYLSVAVLLLGLSLLGCENDLLEPERFGDIEGQVLDFDTQAPLPGVGITTSPPTEAIVTDVDGRFRIEDLPATNYTIAGRLSGYATNSVTVVVRDDATTSAVLFLQEEEADTTTSEARFEADVLNFSTRARSDTTFVVVEYRARNAGTADIARYEIYFQLLTDGPTFFEEVAGENLGVGQSDIGEFEQFVGGFEVAEVEISDVFFEEASE